MSRSTASPGSNRTKLVYDEIAAIVETNSRRLVPRVRVRTDDDLRCMAMLQVAVRVGDWRYPGTRTDRP